jgi:DedD protein
VERHVKERLVGAAVLMAAAIILIPEMLSGPDRSQQATQSVARAPSEAGLKTYSIDLNNPPGSSASSPAQAVPDERVPPPEEVVPAPAQENASNTQSTAPTPAAASESNPEPAPQRSPTPQVAEPASRVATTAPTPTEKPAPKPVETPPARAPLASANNVPTSRGWAVQLGSFSNRASADKLAAEFRSGRDDVFVMPVKTGATTLYRVRIGPMAERAAAEDTLRRVKTKVPGAAVVAHP